MQSPREPVESIFGLRYPIRQSSILASRKTLNDSLELNTHRCSKLSRYEAKSLLQKSPKSSSMVPDLIRDNVFLGNSIDRTSDKEDVEKIYLTRLQNIRQKRKEV